MYFDYHNRLKQLLNAEQYIVIPENGKPFIYRFMLINLRFWKIFEDYA